MKCFNCAAETENRRFGIPICEHCEADLRLFTDATIQQQQKAYRANAAHRSYRAEIEARLDFVEKDYLKKKLKLLHVLERLGS